MGRRAGTVAAVVAGVWVAVAGAAGAQPGIDPGMLQPVHIPPRTALAVRTLVPGAGWGTDNETEERGALSIAKLFMADYALRHGDGSAEDRDLGERMIRKSDDAAANRIAAKYPYAIDSIAKEYNLPATHGAGGWEMSTTSVADVADFLAAKLRDEPDSPILAWMEQPSDKAADGTRQDWGTARLPQVYGTKWGWADVGAPEVASVSFGPGFTVAAHTYGTAEQQTEDVLAAWSALTALVTPKH
ncbi:serine hydrolase [Nocardia niigatensis]|uniref:serine hydrolase n=1 Tax=Nocardia niigatensis TaxID=209249 RepID=UPI000593B621|nr:serine hydrolase [Nocardia niigatensis]